MKLNILLFLTLFFSGLLTDCFPQAFLEHEITTQSVQQALADVKALHPSKNADSKETTQSKFVMFDLNRVNSSTEKGRINFDFMDESVSKLEQQLTLVQAELSTFKTQLAAVKQAAREQALADKLQIEKLTIQLRDTHQELLKKADESVQAQVRVAQLEETVKLLQPVPVELKVTTTNS